jgi:nitrile hydratase accessory protein
VSEVGGGDLTAVLDVDGPAAPPRSNGELVFAEPWESRAFGMAVALHSQGAFEWDDFRAELMRTIAAWERDHGDGDGEEWSYYRCWLTALERVLRERRIVGTGEVDDRAVALAERPAGHDHRDHEHDH